MATETVFAGTAGAASGAVPPGLTSCFGERARRIGRQLVWFAIAGVLPNAPVIAATMPDIVTTSFAEPALAGTGDRNRQIVAVITMRKAKPKRQEVPPPIIQSLQTPRMEECRQRIDAALQPSQLIKLSEECIGEFSGTQFAEYLQHIVGDARHALDIQRSIGLSSDFFADSVGDTAYRDNLGKAVRGDRDAAYLIALAYRTGTFGVAASSRRMEQWLRFSAELGSGLASWELAEFYNYSGLVADAARYEKKALDLGYMPGFRLPTRGY